MSGMKPLALTEFYRRLHARGVATNDLAFVLGVSGGTVRKLLGGIKARRGPTWKGLQEILLDEEKVLLATVEQCSTWTAQQHAKRPR